MNQIKKYNKHKMNQKILKRKKTKRKDDSLNSNKNDTKIHLCLILHNFKITDLIKILNSKQKSNFNFVKLFI